MNTVGNIFSGQVVGETAKTLSERFGKVLQKRQSMTLSRSDKSTSISTQLDSLIPASKISTLTQGMFVGAVADNFDERIEQKISTARLSWTTKSESGNGPVQEDTTNYRLHGRERDGSHETGRAGKLRTYQGRGRPHRRRGTGTYQERPGALQAPAGTELNEHKHPANTLRYLNGGCFLVL